MSMSSKKLKINLVITMLSAAISLTSFLYLTYAWFSFKREAGVTAMTVQASGDISYELKYFTKNYSSNGTPNGYQSPDVALSPSDIVTVDNYDTQFLPISEDPYLNGIQTVIITAQYPSLRFTYALEVTGDFAIDKTVFLRLTDYVAVPSTTFYNATTNTPINLAQAINVYSTAVDGNSGNITAGANSFVTSTSQTDRFNQTASSGPSNINLAQDVLDFDEVPADKIIFFFTIEFSNAPSTYYSYSYTSSGHDYYFSDVEGTSNVYKNLSFSITELSVSIS